MMKYKNIVKQIFDAYLCGKKHIKANDYIGNENIWDYLNKHRLDMIFFDLISNKTNIPSKFKNRCENTKRICIEKDKIVCELNQVPGIFLKGVPLSRLLYRNVYHRRYHDIDILIERKNINNIESYLLKQGYQYGYEYKGKIYIPSRKELIFKQLYSHECYEMFKINRGGIVSYVDINFLFSWVDVNDLSYKNEKSVTEIFENKELQKNTITTLNWEYMFVHLCCHFYNEAHYIETDNEYHEERDYNIILIRLLDIALVLKQKLNLKKIKWIVEKLECESKVGYVLALLEILLEYDYKWLFNYLKCEIKDEIVNGYYTKNGNLNLYEKPILERVYG